MTDQPMACYWGPRHAWFDFDTVRVDVKGLKGLLTVLLDMRLLPERDEVEHTELWAFDDDPVRAWLCELSLSTYYAKEPPTLPTRDPRVEKGPTHTHARATRQE